jgi:hypothetical protein
MATTTNYGWVTPDDTSLVKDGAAAIRTLGSSVDTTTKALNPSTTLGDIEYRSSTANTNTRLAIGSTGNILTVAGGVPTWAAPAGGGGKVLQVVTTTKTSAFTVNSTTMTDVTGLSVSITPSATSSKILVMVDISGAGTPGSSLIYTNLLRGSTIVTQGDAAGASPETRSTTAAQNVDSNATASWSINFLDSPATTAATTYKIQVSGTSGYVNRSTSGNYARTTSTITVMEIGA